MLCGLKENPLAAWLARHLAENPTDTADDAKHALEREAKKGNKKKRAKFGWAVEIL